MAAARVIHTPLPSEADVWRDELPLMRDLAMEKTTMSKTKARMANVAPKPAMQDVKSEPWNSRMCETSPRMVAMPANPAAMGWRMRT